MPSHANGQLPSPSPISDGPTAGRKHLARRDAVGVRLVTRNGYDFAGRFPLAAAAIGALPARSDLRQLNRNRHFLFN